MILPHLPPATLQLLVDYVYRGEAAVTRLELATFLAAARELQLEVAGLHQVCTFLRSVSLQLTAAFLI